MARASVWDLVVDYLAERTEAGSLDPMTARNYRSALRRFTAVVDHKYPHELTANDVLRWRESRAHLTPTSIRHQAGMVRNFLGWMDRNGHLGAGQKLEKLLAAASENVARRPRSEVVLAAGGTLGSLVEPYLEERMARGEMTPLTARNNRSVLYGFAAVVGDLPAEQVGEDEVGRWLETTSHLKPATRRSQFSMVKTFCRWLRRRGHLPADPTAEMKPPRQPRSVPRALPVASVGTLLDGCPDARARATVMLMVGMGLRCCEVAELQIGDWDRWNEMVRIEGKGGHQRELPVPPEVVEALEEYLKEYPAASGPLIRSYLQPSRGLLADTISGMVSEWMAAAGIKRMARDGVGAHSLRHSAASDVLDACKDLRVVQAMLGHEHLTTTAIYLRRAGLVQMREAMSGRRYRATQSA